MRTEIDYCDAVQDRRRAAERLLWTIGAIIALLIYLTFIAVTGYKMCRLRKVNRDQDYAITQQLVKLQDQIDDMPKGDPVVDDEKVEKI